MENQLIQPSLNLEVCIDADACAAELKRCADEADKCAAYAQAGAELAIRHAWNAGAVCNKAKEIIPHGEFQSWLEANAGERGYRTLAKWMKLSKVNLDSLLGNPNVRGLKDAYIATGILPEPELKETEEQGKAADDKPPFTPFKYSTNPEAYHLKEWRDDIRYQIDRLGAFRRALDQRYGDAA